MELQMFLGDRFIDALYIADHQLNTPGYITYLKQKLLEKNEDALEVADDDPLFVLHAVPSRMNIWNQFDAVIDSLTKNNKHKE